MTLEEALNTAIEFEEKVHDLYSEAYAQEEDPAAKRTLEVLAKEEAYHLEFLKKRREEWLKTGAITEEKARTLLPEPDKIANAAETLRLKMAGKSTSTQKRHVDVLRRAQKVEEAASEFYKRMVSELDGPGRAMFQRFVEIEEGHLALVSAELDCVLGLGFWFDVREFDIEGA